jgi:hypothetical protein
MAIAFGLGLLWMFLVSVQTKLLVKSKNGVLLFVWVLGTSLVWGYLVRVVALNERAIIPYALGTALGAVLAWRLGKRWN